MCGIAGWIGPKLDVGEARRMIARLAHRGPDDEGDWQEGGVWLGQRRLSIVDLSPAGHQPMLSASGRYVVTFNGEIYNYPEIMAVLKGVGHSFRGHSDTEVMLAAFEEWGVEGALLRFNGMFAFAVWDRKERNLLLARDRMGEKPFYYAERDGEIAFASELSALWQLPWLDKTVDRAALAAYFRYLCVPAPATIVRGARKLRPGEMLKWKDGKSEISSYWSVRQATTNGLANPLAMSFKDAADELEELLRDAVRIRLRSDVPYGALLSGGIDSSLTVALMQQEAKQPVSTFTIGFKEKSHDESVFAREIASHIGTSHAEEILNAQDVIDLVPKIASLHDEPFADSSSIPTFLLSQFARRHVKVVLSGDGGDELFGGYPRYFWAGRIEHLRHRLTPQGAAMLGRTINSIPAALLNNADRYILGGKLGGANGLAMRAQRFGAYLMHPPTDVYDAIVSAWKRPAEILLGEFQENQMLSPQLERYADLPWAGGMMAVDQEHYLPDDILTKMDRASMAVALEARAPLLDHRLVEWAARVPLQYKLSPHGDTGKLLLREVLYRHVPQKLIDRPKMGFGMPVGSWLRKELRGWAEEMLTSSRLTNVGLNADAVIRVWREHLARKNRLPEIWTVLMWVQWQEKWNAKL
nr:asparagine synthase (glutamine-hydrolyzing) [uncultured Rhodoferax sp.]